MSDQDDGLPDDDARRRALLDHEATLLVEAGAGSGKTALMAGRIALLLAAGVSARDIVAISFTEASASELFERITRFVGDLNSNRIPVDLRLGLPNGLSTEQASAIAIASKTLDELTCTTIHGFCQQLLKPYPVEAGIDPGAVIIDPAAAELAYQDLIRAWLSARFGRDRGDEGLGRIPSLPPLGEEDFFVELLLHDPDIVIKLIQEAAAFLRTKRTARVPVAELDIASITALSESIGGFAGWYADCGFIEGTTGTIIDEMGRLKKIIDDAMTGTLTGRQLLQIFLHEHPECRHSTEPRFKNWGHKGKWEKASIAAGFNKSRGGQFSDVAKAHYERCSESYRAFVGAVTNAAFARFVGEFKTLRNLYAEYKRQAALLDFDDLLHHSRDLLAGNEAVRQALSVRYPRILVDEFQDTDPIQAEILWRLCGEGSAQTPWASRNLRPGSLFLVGDPKQAIYRFRGADVDTYLVAKHALERQPKDSVLKITANFRSLKPILDFVNCQFDSLLSGEMGQPGFTALEAILLPTDDRPSVACFDIVIEEKHRADSGRISVDAVRQEEATTVAMLINRLIGSYKVRDKGSAELRPCRAGDIALLAPTGTNLWIYERALENEGISIASQAGKSFLRRQEVQDLIAIARAIADRRDTLALGALLRGPLVGINEEEIADAIISLPQAHEETTPRLDLWTDVAAITHPILRRTLEVLQSLARKARQTTPYQLMAEAVEELCVRPKLRARHRRGAERALANVELFLEMARPYDARGIVSFVEALRADWQDGERQPEGRPDADADAVSITTIHSAKGLEWPIVIPINSPTVLSDKGTFLHRPSDDTVHFKLLGEAGPEYELVKDEEKQQTRRERIRLWYVALTRACDLLLLPRQSEREANDWFSLLQANLGGLPAFDHMTDSAGSTSTAKEAENPQDESRWSEEAATLAATRRTIKWRSPSRHESEGSEPLVVSEDEIYTDTSGPGEPPKDDSDAASPVGTIQGGRERGLLLHKLIEEVLTGETDAVVESLVARAKKLLAELNITEAERPQDGPHAQELAATTLRALAIPEVAALRPRLVPEITVLSADTSCGSIAYVGGVADALAFNDDDTPDVVIEWKSDIAPGTTQIALYREQIGDYLVTTGAREGLLVFVSSGRVEHVYRQSSVKV